MKMRLAVSLLLLVVICGGFIGCGTPEAEPSDLFQRYQRLSADHTALQHDYGILLFNYEQLKDVKKEYSASLDKYNDLAHQYGVLQVNYAALEAQSNAMTVHYEELFNTIAPDKDALRVMNEKLQEAVARVVACTPRDFASFEELEAWRMGQKNFGKNTVANCRAMQREAWASGRILSVRVETKDCIAFVGDKVYRIKPSYDVEQEDEEDFACVWKVK